MAVIRKNAFRMPSVQISTLLFVCALLPALLFKGPQFEYFAITQVLLVVWLGTVVLQTYEAGLSIPKTPLALCLTLFWIWLAVSLTWSLAPNISVFNFWWVGSLVLVFWLYTLTPERDMLWSHAAIILLVLALVLALMGIYQVLVFEQQARSVFETRNTHAAFLNLVTVPASAYFLILIDQKNSSRYRSILLGAVLYVLFYSIFTTASRGGTVSLVISMGVLAALTLRYASRRGITLLLLLTVAAYLSTKISHGELSERMPQLFQDTGRMVIWESSWELLRAAPWKGIGLGLFYLAYPPYRNPVDNSGGFFAHNDYLQIWIETGLPGMLLLVSVLFAAFWLLIRTLPKTGSDNAFRIELSGLFCGLLAVAGHSIVDFNLYILSIMMASGLLMGRFHDLAIRKLRVTAFRIRFSRIVGRQAYPAIVILLFLLPIFYFIALGLANSYYDKALLLAREGKLQEADINLATASRFTPSDDRILIAHADLYRHAATLLPADAEGGKKSLFNDSLKFLDSAEQANPLRALTHVIRGRLYQQNPALAGDTWQLLAAESYRRALNLNPKLFLGRLDYAELLLQSGQKEMALETLEAGVKYEYYPMPNLIPFYSLTARLMREAGKIEQATVLENKVADLEKRSAASYHLRGY